MFTRTEHESDYKKHFQERKPWKRKPCNETAKTYFYPSYHRIQFIGFFYLAFSTNYGLQSDLIVGNVTLLFTMSKHVKIQFYW